MANRDIYVVTIDGQTEPYGSEIFLVGVYDSLELACEAMKIAKHEYYGVYPKMTVVPINQTSVPFLDKYFDCFVTGNYLGGYTE